MTAAAQVQLPSLDDMKQFAAYWEWRYGLPDGLLYAMMGNASRWGEVAPPDGTKGLYGMSPAFVQFVRQTFDFSFDPDNPVGASQAAAMFLNWAWHRFGAWDLAVAAYQWGWQAVAGFLRAKVMGLPAQLPVQTVDYIAAVAPQYLRK